MRISNLFVILSLFLPVQAFGQICNISEYPYGFVSENRPIIHGRKFMEISEDLPFIEESERRKRYSEFWIDTDVLNIRSGPGLEYDVVSETYYGNLIFAYAKRGNWVAISMEFKHNDIKRSPTWVNIKFLSPKRTTEQVDTKVLQRRCSFETFGKYPNSVLSQEAHDPCSSVYGYLMQQSWLYQHHAFAKKYEDWRQSQDAPDEYIKPPCGI